jgi:PIN domain nuclease of toxin-antitoxin system
LRILLDTHLVLWALNDSRRLGKQAIALLQRSDVWVSAASVWEVSIKASLGKLKADPESVLRAIEPAGYLLLPITAEHAARVFTLGMHHQDPFDRLLVAQAQMEAMMLLTNDEVLEAYGSSVKVL